jgi:hypothetical protein
MILILWTLGTMQWYYVHFPPNNSNKGEQITLIVFEVRLPIDNPITLLIISLLSSLP